MALLRHLSHLLRNLFRKQHVEADLSDEVRAYLESLTREKIAAGTPPEQARREALVDLGGAEQVKEQVREARAGALLDQLWQDVRYGARMMRSNPVFTLVAVLTLALGIGANTAIFDLLNAVLLRSLPVKDPHELAEVRNVVRRPRTGNFDGRRAELTYPLWVRIRDRQEAFSAIAAWFSADLNLAAEGEARLASNALWVSGDFFNVLGVRPILGRVFTVADDQRGCGSPGVILSYPFWQRELGGEPSAIGRKITLNGHPFEVLGVTPASFFGVEVGRQYDLAIPLCADTLLHPENKRLDRLDGWWLAAIGRLKPGWTIERATAQLTAISPALYEETLHPGYNPEDAKNYLALRLGAVPAANGVSGLRTYYATPLWLLLAATGVVLLIACANLANLMLARASARERELAVRLALGASRGRLVRQMLTESLLLAALGAVVGGRLARALSQAIVALISVEGSPRFLDFAADWRMLLFAGGLALLTCILFGLAPALRATRTPPAAAMSTGSRSATDSRERFGLRRVLVASQIALSLLLLTGALLFGGTLRNLMTLDAGFQQDGVLQLDVELRVPAQRAVALSEELLARVRATPGVAAAATSDYIPMAGNSWDDNVLVEFPSGERKAGVFFDRVSSGFFHTLAIPLLSGRDFDAGDTAAGRRVAIVNESFARKFFDGGNPVGQTFRIEEDAGAPRPLFHIVGLVKDAKYQDMRADFAPMAYFPSRQGPQGSYPRSMLIRSALPVEATAAAVKRAVGETDAAISFRLLVFKAQIRESLVQERVMAMLTGLFGVLGLVLASLGLYGVMSYAVARRTNEIGIRMALGARQGRILSMILGEAGVLLVIGLVIGSALALAATRVTRTMLFGLEPHDPLTLALAAALLSTVAVAASYFPARRAARLDPMSALRLE